MRIVADTNVFLAVAMNEPEKAGIIRITQGHELVAPKVLPYELGNALTAMHKRCILSPKEITAACVVIQTVPFELRSLNIRSALELAGRYRIYAYDAYFLECALSFRLPLITLDAGMKRHARDLQIQLLE